MVLDARVETRPCVHPTHFDFLGCPGICGLECWFPLSRKEPPKVAQPVSVASVVSAPPAQPQQPSQPPAHLSPGIIMQSDPPDALVWLAEHLADRRPHELADVLAEARLVGLEAETVYRAVYRLKDCVIGAWPGGATYLQMHLPPGT
jgi:hypothetical protein